MTKSCYEKWWSVTTGTMKYAQLYMWSTSMDRRSPTFLGATKPLSRSQIPTLSVTTRAVSHICALCDKTSVQNHKSTHIANLRVTWTDTLLLLCVQTPTTQANNALCSLPIINNKPAYICISNKIVFTTTIHFELKRNTSNLIIFIIGISYKFNKP